MSTPNPADTVTQLVKAVNQGDLEAAVACYEANATLIVQPGQVATGEKAIREALAGFIAMKVTITTETHKTLQTGDIGLFISRWTANSMGGASSIVLRRQTDGRWLIAIDNPFGAAILD